MKGMQKKGLVASPGKWVRRSLGGSSVTWVFNSHITHIYLILVLFFSSSTILYPEWFNQLCLVYLFTCPCTYFIGDERTNLKDTGKAIFRSDFIYFYYFNDINDINYLYKFPSNYEDYILYIGRIKAIGLNYINDFINYKVEITIIIEKYITI